MSQIVQAENQDKIVQSDWLLDKKQNMKDIALLLFMLCLCAKTMYL
jgi:hypothetical protein